MDECNQNTNVYKLADVSKSNINISTYLKLLLKILSYKTNHGEQMKQQK